MKCATRGNVKSFERKCLFCFGKNLKFAYCNDCLTGFDLWKADISSFGHEGCNVTIITNAHNEHKELLKSCLIDGCLSEVIL